MGRLANSPTSEAGDLGGAQRRRPAFNGSNLLGLAFASLVILAMVVLVRYGLFDRGTPEGPGILSKEAPDFTLDLFGGGTFTLSEMRNQPVVVSIWASWCPYCRDELPTFEKVWQDYQERGAAFVGVNVRDNDEDATAVLEAFDVNYPNGPDRGDEVYESYEITGVPEVFFIDRDGIVVRKFIGPVTEAQLTSSIEDLLGEE
jgi:cytochrome c biogenesis protein CcmG/thiol:disulfide interchange protein DsbE